MGQTFLSSQAEISLITCGPGQNELYSAFGHSALRVKDPSQALDIVFNYGTFDFDQPNFYLNFARGALLYQLSVNSWDRFIVSYQREGRYVHEQVLNLDSSQAQSYFNFLLRNASPEHRAYYYDYFYDNCATRIRDGLSEALEPEVLEFSGLSFYQPPLSIRQLCDEYLAYQAWGDLGIDICLGLPMDKEADQQIEMFLPDLLEKAFADAKIRHSGISKPLIKESRELLRQTVIPEKSLWTPFFFFGALLVLIVLLTVLAYNKLKLWSILDGILFSISGLLGLFLLALWLLTDHQAAAWNFNIAIFLPFNLLVLAALFRGKLKTWQRKYISYLPYYYALLLAVWMFLPQQLPMAFLPWLGIFILRAWHIARKYASV